MSSPIIADMTVSTKRQPVRGTEVVMTEGVNVRVQ